MTDGKKTGDFALSFSMAFGTAEKKTSESGTRYNISGSSLYRMKSWNVWVRISCQSGLSRQRIGKHALSQPELLGTTFTLCTMSQRQIGSEASIGWALIDLDQCKAFDRSTHKIRCLFSRRQDSIQFSADISKPHHSASALDPSRVFSNPPSAYTDSCATVEEDEIILIYSTHSTM